VKERKERKEREREKVEERERERVKVRVIPATRCCRCPRRRPRLARPTSA
jgi:hypothetical protein